MALESATYVSGLNASNPASGDNTGQGDDHIRLIKTTLVNTFGQVSGAVTATHTELNHTDGVTSNIQTQLDAKAPLASPVFTGTPGLGTSPYAVTSFTIRNSGDTQRVNIGCETNGDATIWDTPYSSNLFRLTQAGALYIAGLVYGRGGGAGLGQITVSTSDPSGGSDGDLWMKVA